MGPRIINAPRGSAEWHEARRGLVTASEVHRLFEPAPRAAYLRHLDLDLDGVPNHQHEQPPPWFGDGPAQARARALALYRARLIDPAIWRPAEFVVSGDHPWLGTTTDGLLGGSGVLWIQTFATRARLRAVHESYPNRRAVIRLQAMMLVTGTTRAAHWLYHEAPEIGEVAFVQFTVGRDPWWQREIEDAAMQFRTDLLARRMERAIAAS